MNLSELYSEAFACYEAKNFDAKYLYSSNKNSDVVTEYLQVPRVRANFRVSAT